jgi:hypothetical protein
MNQQSATDRRAYVYVATGAGYVAEAQYSAQSLRRVHPQARICLITDSPPTGSTPFSEILAPQGRVLHAPIDKVRACEVDADEVLFLDSDTFIVDTIEEVFGLLTRFDMAAFLDPHPGGNYKLPGVPITFSEFNTGVMVFNNNAKVKELFRLWEVNSSKLWDNLLQQGQPPTTDQPAFRYTLFHSGIRIAPLPAEYHFIVQNPNSLYWKVRLLHGRCDYASVEALANKDLGLRSYLPQLGIMSGFQGRSKLLRQLRGIVWRALFICFVQKKSSKHARPTNWWIQSLDRGGKASNPEESSHSRNSNRE